MYLVKVINENEETVIHNVDTLSENKITGQIQQQVNSIDSFTFTIYSNNAGYNKLKEFTTKVIVIAADTNENVFIGRILKLSNEMQSNGICSRTVTCEGELGFLCDSIQMHRELNNANTTFLLSTILSQHNKQVDEDKQIFLGTVSDTSGKYYNFTFDYETSLEAINEKLINNIGGEIRLRYTNGKRYLDYTNTIYSVESDTEIQLAVNMVSAQQTIDPTSLVTQLIPVGAKIGDTDERLTIEEVNMGKNYVENSNLVNTYGIIKGVQIFDDITKKAELKKAGQALVDSQKFIKKQYQVNAVDLSKTDKNFNEFLVGNTYHIINPLISLDDTIRCISKTIDINDPLKTTLNFGDKFDTLTSLTSAKNKALSNEIKTVKDGQTSLIERIVNKQSNLIKGVTDSYYYIDNTEGKERICFMDSPDKDKALNVMQLNKNGIGFSHNGINGDYVQAWTIDGTFNTDFIVANTLTGLKINNGSGTFSVDQNGKVIAKSIDIKGGSIDINTENQSNNIIKLNCGDWQAEYSPLQAEIKNNTDNTKILIQAGAIFGYNGEKQKFVLDTVNGQLQLFNNKGNRTILLDSESGIINCYQLFENYV